MPESRRQHIATQWHIAKSSGGGSILRCSCGAWESDPKATIRAQRDAHRAHRTEMGETVAPRQPTVQERLKAAEAAIARVRDVHRVHRCAVDGHLWTRTPTPCVNDGICACGATRCETLAALDTPEVK